MSCYTIFISSPIIVEAETEEDAINEAACELDNHIISIEVEE